MKNFEASKDTLYFGAAAGNAQAVLTTAAESGLTINAKGMLTGVTTVTDFYAAVAADTTATAGHGFAWTDGTNTYVAVNNGTAAQDTVVKLAGVVATELTVVDDGFQVVA